MKKRIFVVLKAIGITITAFATLFFLDSFIFGAIEAEKKIDAYEAYHHQFFQHYFRFLLCL